MIAYIFAPLGLWATWLVVIGAWTGAGLLARRLLLRERDIDADAMFAAFWFGAAVITLFLQLWHIFAAITRVTFAVVAAAGLIGLLTHGREIRGWLRSVRRGQACAVLAILLLLGWWTADRAIGAVAAFDTYMYHVPAVDWIRSHPLVPGLANLHGRFGFNNASFLLAAWLESGPWVEASPWLLNGVFVFPMLAQIVLSLLRWPAATGSRRPRCALEMVLLTPVLALVASPVLFRSLNADVPAAMAMFAALSLLAGRVRTSATEPAAVGADGLATGAVALAMAVAFKLSVAIAALPACFIAVTRLHAARQDRAARRALVAALALSGIITGTWLARGAVLSGYPLYPMTAIAVPVDWRVPEEQAAAEAAWIRFFARTSHDPAAYSNVLPESVCSRFSWLRPWLRNQLEAHAWWLVLLPLGAGGLLALAALVRRPRGPEAKLFGVWAATFSAGGIVWFTYAPRPLFAFALFWGLAATAASFAAFAAAAGRRADPDDRPTERRGPARYATAGAAILLSLLPIAGFIRDTAARGEGGLIRAAGTTLFDRPDPTSWYEPAQWQYPMLTYTTDSGLSLFVPRGHRCGRAALPCTSHPARNLRLRHPDQLRAGFTVDGMWQAERFPNPYTNFLEVWRNLVARPEASACN